MKIKNLLFIILTIVLVSCGPAATLLPTETTIPLATSTSIPSQLTRPTEPLTPVSVCGQSVSASSTLRKFTSETYLITFEYPANWECAAAGNDPLKYSGTDGFFLLYPGYIPAESAQEVCDTQADQSVGKGQNLYGASPTVEIVQADNQPGCLVLPSEDQPSEKRGGALLVVKYPFEYPEMGKNSTRVLVLLADKNHIRDFVASLKFIR